MSDQSSEDSDSDESVQFIERRQRKHLTQSDAVVATLTIDSKLRTWH